MVTCNSLFCLVFCCCAPVISSAPSSGPASASTDIKKIFVGGLAHSVNDDAMKEFFGKYGTVLDATVMYDRNTGKSRGFGFVTFDSVVGTFLLLLSGTVCLYCRLCVTELWRYYNRSR